MPPPVTDLHVEPACGIGIRSQVLEHLDRMGVTRRQGDARIVLRGGDLFG